MATQKAGLKEPWMAMHLDSEKTGPATRAPLMVTRTVKYLGGELDGLQTMPIFSVDTVKLQETVL